MLDTTHAIYMIERVPLELPAVVLDNYSAMKLGVGAAAGALAELFVEPALALLAAAPGLEWVLSSPARRNIHCGANLIARGLFELLRQRELPTALTFVELDSSGAHTADVYRHAVNYADFDAQARQAWSESNYVEFRTDAQLHGRALLFVNDICVTGTQQRGLAPQFEAAGIVRVDWLYLLAVEPELGRRDAKIEHRLNTTSWQTIAELVELLLRDDIEYTGKCVATLLALELAELEWVLDRLGARRRAVVRELASIEGCWSCASLLPKLQLLEPRS